jgi:peptidylprolyl isomerase
MSKKEDYKKRNIQFLEDIKNAEGVQPLHSGVYYKIIETGNGQGEVKPFSVVTCHYKGSLINGRVFDNSFDRNVPEAFRVKDLISGFQIALMAMHIGDHWEVYIPSSLGYGPRGDSEIPGNSTLIFEIKLISIA